MPLLSFFKRLVSAEELPVEQQQQQQQQIPPSEAADGVSPTDAETTQADEKKQPLPPPPPSTPFIRSQPPTNAASTASLRSRVELERKTASSASIYTDFTRGGHADAGHWNDPPTTVFKKQQPQNAAEAAAAAAAVTPSEIGGSDASSFMVVDAKDKMPADRQGQMVLIKRILHSAIDDINAADSSPMAQRMAEDSAKRLALMDERLDAVDDALVATLCTIAVLVEAASLADAASVLRDLLQTDAYTAELKWLVGVKRIIELLQKN
ncbi:hypothetical protein H4217_005489 [Coemansia sp. RSA 1939]|nr:hypothetical protein H4217_005489 [Coemansia sp. RSA 1939]